MKSQISPYDLNSRLVLLLLHFPSLKILWSISPYETAIIFRDLKANKSGPINPSTTTNNLSDERGEALPAETKTISANTNAREMLLRMPGVHTTNVHRLMQAFQSMRVLVRGEELKFGEMLGDEDGRRLYKFINSQLQTDTTTKD